MATNRILSAVKAIRANCKGCMGGPLEKSWARLIKGCTSRGCPLWSYRFGTRPATAIKAGKDVVP